jgi:endonuclease/exonuclease/phosphatase (EEP) superfamily protein YafD
MIRAAKERRFYRVLIWVAFIAVSAGSLIALFGKYFWIAELFTHFRPYYLLIQALLMLIFLHGGRRLLMVMTILLAMPNAWVVGPYLIPMTGSVMGPVKGQSRVMLENNAGIDIVALNVQHRNDEFVRVADYLRDRDPDIIVIAEFTAVWRIRLEFLRESHPYYLMDARSDPWGLAVFSRLPLVDAELIDLAQTGTVHARFIVTAGEAPLEIFAVHLLSPVSAVLAHDRNLQLEALASHVLNSKNRRVVIGDMNLTPFSPYFNLFTDQTGLQDARRVDGFHVTWPASLLPIWMPIDHALADPEVNITRVLAGPDVGSDHFPLEIFVAE